MSTKKLVGNLVLETIIQRMIKFFACILGGVALTACTGEYKEENNKMYYSYRNDWGPVSKREVEGADLKSFKILKSVFPGGKLYAVDKNQAYWRGLVIENADVNTFKVINEYYSVDSKRIFWEGKILSTADPKTLKVLINEYALDSDSVYFQGNVLSGADSKTFTAIGHYYAKDKNAVYDQGRVLDEISDPSTFRLLGKPDKEIKSWFGFIRALDEDMDHMIDWGCDKSYYYREGRKIDGADYSTFTFLDNGCTLYVKDKFHVFYCGRPQSFIVEGADVATFQIINSFRNSAKDKNSYYHEGKKVSYSYMLEEGLIKK
ncbi:MAG: DKNYY domain-containing protein [Tannerella sp.]|jgi:hypothetical protein|nr:DKNYY domain-containing protein [Tannerella sp.]